MILQILNRFFLTSTKVQSLKFDMYFEFVKQTVLKAEPISLHPQLAENVFYFIKPILKKKKNPFTIKLSKHFISGFPNV